MRLALFAILIALASLAHSADDTAAAKAERLLDAMKVGELVTQTMEAGFQAGVKPYIDQAPAEQRVAIQRGVDAAAAFLRKNMTWDVLKGDYVQLYAASFTAPELDELLAFYRSPIGQRLVAQTPDLTGKGMALGAERMQKLMPDLQRIVAETMAETQASDQAEAFAKVGLVVGKPFPDLVLTTTDGGTIATRQLVGKVVLIDYWATWCSPCVRELPNVQKTYQRFHDQGFEVVGISLDEDTAKLAAFVAAKQVPWKQVCDGKGWQSDAAQRFGIDSILSLIHI